MSFHADGKNKNRWWWIQPNAVQNILYSQAATQDADKVWFKGIGWWMSNAMPWWIQLSKQQITPFELTDDDDTDSIECR